MSLQEMQQFQEKHEVARADDIVGTDQPHTASVGMHQGNARDLPDDTQRWRFQVGYINKNLFGTMKLVGQQKKQKPPVMQIQKQNTCR